MLKRKRKNLKKEEKDNIILASMYRRNNKIFFLFAIVLCLIFVSVIACNKKERSSYRKNRAVKIVKKHKFIKKNKKINKNKTKEKKAEEIKKFKYELTLNDRNPFMPFFKITETKIQEEEIPKTPLTSYSITQLKLSAIMIAKGKSPVAMVETQDLTGLFFTVGDYIGTELFKVVKIEPDKVYLIKKEKTLLGEKVIEKVLKIESEME